MAFVRILAGQSLSDAYPLGNLTLDGVIVRHSSWNTASITFAASSDSIDFYPVIDSAGEYSIPITVGGRYAVVDPFKFVGPVSVKIRSGTAASAVVQSVNVTCELLIRSIQ